MTLIAMATNYGQPFITSDVLITSKIGKTDLALPYRPVPLSPEEVRHLIYKPSRFLQKIYVIQPNISICVAGDVLLLKRMIQKFKSFCRLKSDNGKKLLTVLEVTKFFTNYQKAELDKIACGVSIVQELAENFAVAPQLKFGKWEEIESLDFEYVSASGTGMLQYLNHIAWHNSLGSSHQPGDFLHAKQMTFSFIAKLLAKERRTLKSLDKYWGAFFETCFYNGSSFEKIGEIVFVICDAQCDPDGNLNLPEPKLFIYSQYIKNILYLTVVEAENVLHTKSNDSIQFTTKKIKKTLFTAEEIDSAAGTVLMRDDVDLSFKSYEIAMGINISLSPNHILPMGIYSAGVDESVEFLDGETINFTWPVRMQEIIQERIKKVYPDVVAQVGGFSPLYNDKGSD